MNNLLLTLCLICALASCKNPAKTDPTQESQTQKPTNLEKALAVFDEPQIGDEEEFLRTLEIAQFLPSLNKEQVLQVYEKIITRRVLNRDALVLSIQRLARIDPMPAQSLVTGIRGMEKDEIRYLHALITYTAGENNLPDLVNYFKAHHDSLDDMGCGSFSGDALKWHFWFEYYKSHPKRIDNDEELDEVYALAKTRRGEFDDLAELSKEYENAIHELSDIEDMILDYGVFADRKKVYHWHKLKDFHAQKRYSDSSHRFQNIFESAHHTYDSLTDIERDLLTVADINPNSILLYLNKIALLAPENHQRILSITTERLRYSMWSELSIASSYIYSKTDALAAYKAIYDPTYSKSTHMTTFPLLELVKTQPLLAAKEYAKLSRWPLITPAGFYPILAENLTFSFCYHLAMSAPDLALELGGKYLQYPSPRGVQASTDPIEGIAYGMAKAGHEQKLIKLLLDVPGDWSDSEQRFDHIAETVMEGIAMYSLEKWQTHWQEISVKYNLDLEGDARIYLYEADPVTSIAYLKSLPEDKEYPDKIADYISCCYELNPILAVRLAEKHNVNLEQLIRSSNSY